jgi:hypothetical protein
MGLEQFRTGFAKNVLTSRGTPITIMADSFPGCGRPSCRLVCFFVLIQDTESFYLIPPQLSCASTAFIDKKRNGIGAELFFYRTASIRTEITLKTNSSDPFSILVL